MALILNPQHSIAPSLSGLDLLLLTVLHIAMRILHISDLHLPAPNGIVLRDLLHPKRLLGWTNLRLRRREAFADGLKKLDALVALVKHEQIDVTVFSGDISSLGTSGELVFSRRALRPLIDVSPEWVCVPGNHDVYISRDPWLAHFSALCSHGEAFGPGPSGWPRVRDIGALRVVALDTTKPNPHLYSTGRLSEAQLRGLLAACKTDRRVVIVLHHGPFGRDGLPDRRSHGITNYPALVEVLKQAPAHAVLLHGHTHHQFALKPEGLPYVLCAGSATQAGRERFWVLESAGPKGWQVASGRWENGGYRVGETVPIGDLCDETIRVTR